MLPFVLTALAIALCVPLSTTRAEPIQLNLTGDRYWAVLASRQNVDEAIAEAAYGRADLKAFVVRADNGWYAAISGPYTAAQGAGRKVLDDLIVTKGAPKDAYFTRGASFSAVVWTEPATNVIATLSYDGEHDARLSKDGLEIVLSRTAEGQGSDAFAATATATYEGKPAFKIAMTSDYPAAKPASDVTLVRLDPASPMPQVVFTYFWRGAHCCTITKIATLDTKGEWHVIDGETLDGGGGGYSFEDLEGKRFSILVSEDQSFKYAFASYADSLSPVVLHQLVGTTLIDVTAEPRFRDRLLQDLDGDVNLTTDSPDFWNSNGFLAAWVAGSMRVGTGDAAWAKMLVNYDHHSEFTPQSCAIDKLLADCPKDKLMTPSFPAALRTFLVEHGYIKDAARYPVPYAVEPN